MQWHSKKLDSLGTIEGNGDRKYIVMEYNGFRSAVVTWRSSDRRVGVPA